MSRNENHILCYYAKRNAQAFAVNMIVFGSRTFLSAKHIKDIDKLGQLISFLDKNQPSPEVNLEMTDFLFSTLIDWIRIIICFENFMKAVLLLNGCLIHKIDRSNPSVKTLGNHQNKRPIILSEYKRYHDFKFDPNDQKWFLEGVKVQTIDFNTLLRKKYQEIIRLPQDILAQLIEINNKRNTLHFYHEGRNSYSMEFIDELKKMKGFVKDEMMNLVGHLEHELNKNSPPNPSNRV